jgi:hypothetical protein
VLLFDVALHPGEPEVAFHPERDPARFDPFRHREERLFARGRQAEQLTADRVGERRVERSPFADRSPHVPFGADHQGRDDEFAFGVRDRDREARDAPVGADADDHRLPFQEFAFLGADPDFSGRADDGRPLGEFRGRQAGQLPVRRQDLRLGPMTGPHQHPLLGRGRHERADATARRAVGRDFTRRRGGGAAVGEGAEEAENEERERDE